MAMVMASLKRAAASTLRPSATAAVAAAAAELSTIASSSSSPAQPERRGGALLDALAAQLEETRAAGLFKAERLITSAQVVLVEGVRGW